PRNFPSTMPNPPIIPPKKPINPKARGVSVDNMPRENPADRESKLTLKEETSIPHRLVTEYVDAPASRRLLHNIFPPRKHNKPPPTHTATSPTKPFIFLPRVMPAKGIRTCMMPIAPLIANNRCVTIPFIPRPIPREKASMPSAKAIMIKVINCPHWGNVNSMTLPPHPACLHMDMLRRKKKEPRPPMGAGPSPPSSRNGTETDIQPRPLLAARKRPLPAVVKKIRWKTASPWPPSPGGAFSRGGRTGHRPSPFVVPGRPAASSAFSPSNPQKNGPARHGAPPAGMTPCEEITDLRRG